LISNQETPSLKGQLFYLIAVMATVALAIAGISIWLLYNTAFEEEKARLAEAAQSQARMIEAVARFNAKHSEQDHPKGAAAATLQQITEAHENYRGFGATGEFTLARRQNDQIVFVLRHRHYDLDKPKPAPWLGELAEPMRRALKGLSGVVVALDYRGATVLAAHEPVAILNMGIVAKIDLAEIRAPFIKAAIVTLAGGFLIVVIGGILFRRAIVPSQERARIAAALHESENKFENLVIESRHGVIIVSRGRKVLFCNQAAAEIYGYESPAELLALTDTFNLVAPYERDRFAEYRQAWLSGDNVSSVFEFEGLRKDGGSVHIHSVQTFLDWEGEPAIQYAVIDVTETKALISELNETAWLLNKAQNLSHVGHWRLNAATLEVNGSDELFRIFGLGDREATLEAFAGAVHPDDREYDLAHIQRGLEKGESWDIEHRLLDGDGNVKHVRAAGEATLRRDGQVESLFGTIQDITEQKLVGEALRDSEQQLRLITNALPTAIFYVDTTEHYRFVNSVTEDWLARPAEEILASDIREILGDKIYRQLHPHVRAALSGTAQEFEAVIDFPDGRSREMAFTYVPHFGSDGAVAGYFGLGIDVTERHALEERLRQSQKMEAIGQLTGGIAHEFNNLLQVVGGNIALLEDDFPTDAETSRRIQAVNRNVTRGAELTSRLLSFARRQPLQPKALVIGEVLAGMQGLLGQTLGETIEVNVEQAGDIWMAEADPGQLENALLNLVLNARDAMPKGGMITLSADNVRLDEQAAAHEEAMPGDYVVLSVADTGSGMTKEDISHAFEPFFTTKDVGKGTGLGLSMVYGFAQQSGGFAAIESVEGQGTTMRLFLPRLIQAEDIGVVAGDRPPESELPASGTILLVEDDADVREILASQLTRLGYRVIEAEDGAAALNALADEKQVDLLFTDVVMPGGLNGLELARQVLQLRPELKVLYSTGYSEDVVGEAGEMRDGAIVLRKPYNQAKLAATISQILN